MMILYLQMNFLIGYHGHIVLQEQYDDSVEVSE